MPCLLSQDIRVFCQILVEILTRKVHAVQDNRGLGASFLVWVCLTTQTLGSVKHKASTTNKFYTSQQQTYEGLNTRNSYSGIITKINFLFPVKISLATREFLCTL